MRNRLTYLFTIMKNNKRILEWILVAVAVVPGMYLRFSQILKFNIIYGYDGEPHLRYIMSLCETGMFPSPYALMEGYQPPLYYWLSSLTMRLCAMSLPLSAYLLKTMSTATGLLLFVCAYETCTMLTGIFHDTKRTVRYGIICMLYLPMHIYLSPMPGNEMLSAVLISTALFVFIGCIEQRDFSLLRAVILGIFLGLSLLTKYTGLLMCLTVVATLIFLVFLKPVSRPIIVRFGILCAAVTVAIAGWWYARNAILYGDPLIKSNDLQEFAHIYKKQPPGHHRLADFFTFNFHVFAEPLLGLKTNSSVYNPVYNNIPAGTFATAWLDNHQLYLRIDGPIGFTIAQCLLITGFAVTCFTLFGFGILIIRSIRSKKLSTIPLFILAGSSCIAYISYNCAYPYFYHVKAFFLMHLFIPVMLGYCCAADWVLNRHRH